MARFPVYYSRWSLKIYRNLLIYESKRTNPILKPNGAGREGVGCSSCLALQEAVQIRPAAFFDSSRMTATQPWAEWKRRTGSQGRSPEGTVVATEITGDA